MSLSQYPPPTAPGRGAFGSGTAGRIRRRRHHPRHGRAPETVEAIAAARAQFGVSKHVWIADQGSEPRTWRSSSPPWRARRTPPWCGSTAIGGGRRRAEPRHRARCRPGDLRARQRRRVRRAGHPGAPSARWTRSPTSPPSPAASSSMRPAPRTCPPGAIRPPCCRAPPRASTRRPLSAPATPSAAPISRRRAATTMRSSSRGPLGPRAARGARRPSFCPIQARRSTLIPEGHPPKPADARPG
jgi:hypothetical protein